MPDIKLIVILNSLSGVEKREFSKWIKSPFFCKKEELQRFWNWILEHKGRLTFDIEQINEAFSHVFPGDPFDMPRWRHLQSHLCQQIESFLAQRAYAANPLEADLHLIPVLRQKQLPKVLSATFRRAEHRLQSLPEDIEYYHHWYQLEWQKFAAYQSAERDTINNLGLIGHSLDVYLVASKLRLACMMTSHQTVYPINYDNSFLPAILMHVEQTSLMQIPAVALYYHCYLAISEGTESAFLALRKQLEDQQAGLPLQERRAFLLLAINYCIKQLNTGDLHYVREALDLYQTGLETGILIENGYLSRFAYKNIVALGLKLKKFEWVEIFIEHYTEYLKENYRYVHGQYNLARLYFTKQEYEKAMPMLALIDDRDLLLNLDAKVMLLKMYYERQEWDTLDNLLTSFRVQLLRKKKIIGYHQQYYLNMIRYIKKMMRLNPFDKAGIAQFKQELIANTSVIEKEWLLSQL